MEVSRPEYRDADGTTNSQEDGPPPPPFFCWDNFFICQGSIFGGLLCGYGSGFVGAYSTLYDVSENCGAFRSAHPCVTLSNAKCDWDAADVEQPCVWRDEVRCRRTYGDAASCSDDASCVWSYKQSVCDNKHGYTTLESGLFAGAMTLGCMCSSVISGYLCKKYGSKMVFLIAGLCGIAGCVCYHFSTAFTLFWLLIIGRVLIGFANGFCTVAASLYVNINAHPRHSQVLGTMFQIFSCLGLFVAAVVAILVGKTISYTSSKNANLKGRMQGFSAAATLLSICVLCLGIWLPTGKNIEDTNTPREGGETKAADVREDPPDRYGYCDMLPRLLVGSVVAATLQLTGINAVMSFAPTITSNIGLDPLVGNLIVMFWTYIVTVAAIPLLSLVSMRTLFLYSCLGAAMSCIFLCGIPVIPGVTSTKVKNGVGITGILVYILTFEVGVGPCFYVLAQDLFPPSFRPKGSSVVNTVQFFFTLLINSFYPSATSVVSGGPSGNQDKGQSAAFLFFGAVGIICFVILFFFMFPWEEEAEGSDRDDEPPFTPVSFNEKPYSVQGGIEHTAAADNTLAMPTREE